MSTPPRISTHLRGSESQTSGKTSIRAGNKALGDDFLDITALIRSIQRAEGNPDCFMRGYGDCDRTDCAWRPYCMGHKPGA
ncbi:MAG: hypothetical protein ACLFUL_07755 [Desulfobacteraceae bacterium]